MYSGTKLQQLIRLLEGGCKHTVKRRGELTHDKVTVQVTYTENAVKQMVELAKGLEGKG